MEKKGKEKKQESRSHFISKTYRTTFFLVLMDGVSRDNLIYTNKHRSVPDINRNIFTLLYIT